MAAPIPLYPKQRRFVDDTRRFPAWVGGIGSGKSYAGAAKVLSKIGIPGQGMVAAPNYPMLRDSSQVALFEMMHAAGFRERRDYRYNRSEKTIYFKRTRHTILLRSLDNAQNRRGPNLLYAWVDEASLIEKEDWQIVKGRVRIGPNPQAWVTFTPKGQNYAYEEWVEGATGDERDELRPLYRSSSLDNPALPADFVAGLGYEGNFYDQEILAQFVTFQGLIYDTWTHTTDTVYDFLVPPEWDWTIGVDAGVTNPSAVMTIRSDGPEHVHVSDELYRRGMAEPELLEAVLDAYAASGHRAVVVVDPSAKSLIQQLENLAIEVYKANNNVQEGIRTVRGAMAADFTVSPRCVNWLAERKQYAWKSGRAGDGLKDEPVKKNDHAMDATRYAIMEIANPTPRPDIW